MYTFKKPRWLIRESNVTNEDLYFNRREFIKKSSKQRARKKWKIEALNACKKLFPDIDKLEPIFFCQIIASEEEIRPITPARNAIKLKSPIRSEIIIIEAPLNPKNIPIHWYLVRVSFK